MCVWGGGGGEGLLLFKLFFFIIIISFLKHTNYFPKTLITKKLKNSILLQFPIRQNTLSELAICNG